MRRGRVQAWTLDFWQKRDLVMHEDPAVRAAARALLEEDPRQRAQTIRRYAAALDLAGNAARGRAVFARACATCHRLGSRGRRGPRARPRDRPPSAAARPARRHPGAEPVDRPALRDLGVERKGGGSEAGGAGARDARHVTLRQGQGREVTIRRADIRHMAAAPQSSMPADLDKVVAPTRWRICWCSFVDNRAGCGTRRRPPPRPT